MIPILSLFSESYIFFLFYEGSIAVSTALILHCAVVIFLSSVAYTKRKHDLKNPLLLLAMVTVMGPFGSLSYALIAVLHLLYKPTPFSDWLLALFPEENFNDAEDLYEKLIFDHEDFSEKSGILPFKDVLTFGTEEQKRIALAKITRHFCPGFAPALLSAISDPHNTIRVQAATAIAKLEKDFSQKCRELENSLKNDDNNVELLLKTAVQFDDYAFCGIIDDERGQDLRDKAILYYEQYLKSNPDDKNAIFSLGRQYLRNRSYKKAEQLFEECLKKKMSSDVTVWYMETLFNLRSFDKLRSFAKNVEITTSDIDSFQTKEMVELWSS